VVKRPKRKEKLVENWIKKHECLRLWRKTLDDRKSTSWIYRYFLWRFFTETKTDPEEYLNMCRNEKTKAKAIFHSWVNSLELADNTKHNIVNAMNHLLKFHDIALRFSDKDFGIVLSPEKLDYIPKTNEVSMLIERASINLRPCIALAAYSGMRFNDIVKLTYGDIKNQIYWDEKEQRFKPKQVPLTLLLKQEKTKKYYFTFLGAKGTRILCSYLTMRKKQGVEFKDDTKLFVYSSAKSLGTVIDRLIQQIFEKYPDVRKRLRPYGLRKFFRKKVSVLGDAVAEFLMGHVGGYKSLSSVYRGLRDLDEEVIEELRQQYAKIMLELEGEVPEEYLTDEVEALRKRVKELEEALREAYEIFKLSGILELGEKINWKRFRKLTELGERTEDEILEVIEKETKKVKQKIISENELEEYLSKGWRYVATVNNGRVIVEK